MEQVLNRKSREKVPYESKMRQFSNKIKLGKAKIKQQKQNGIKSK
jgi:hypothetical protein